MPQQFWHCHWPRIQRREFSGSVGVIRIEDGGLVDCGGLRSLSGIVIGTCTSSGPGKEHTGRSKWHEYIFFRWYPTHSGFPTTSRALEVASGDARKAPMCTI